MIQAIIDSNNTLIFFNECTGDITYQEKLLPIKKTKYQSRKKTYKEQIYSMMLVHFARTMSRTEYDNFEKLLNYYDLNGSIKTSLSDISKLEDINIGSLRNMVSKYRLKNEKFMKYLITKQYPEKRHSQ